MSVLKHAILYRIQKENRLFGGLWHGSKPDMGLFLKPLAKFLQSSFENGMYIGIFMLHM